MRSNISMGSRAIVTSNIFVGSNAPRWGARGSNNELVCSEVVLIWGTASAWSAVGRHRGGKHPREVQHCRAFSVKVESNIAVVFCRIQCCGGVQHQGGVLWVLNHYKVQYQCVVL